MALFGGFCHINGDFGGKNKYSSKCLELPNSARNWIKFFASLVCGLGARKKEWGPKS